VGHRFRLVNVFTRDGDPFSGNPLCVFEDARGLDDAAMQALALQFNLSETTFVFPSPDADARVRIFTPGYEMPFAGHPTLGTASVLSAMAGLGDPVRLELNVGVVPVRFDGRLWELAAPRPSSRPARAGTAELAQALGLDAADLPGPALWVDAGSEQLVVPVASAAAVARASVSFEGLTAVTADGARAQAYLFAEDGHGSLVSRFFFSKAASVLEDPATGSATANLGGWYLAQGAALPLTRWISQGAQAGRPSRLRLRIDEAGRVFVAGAVVELGRGVVDL
jgi:trans-2,3-dihydro-3-hydroxyanthranilate isomerase